MIKKFIVCALLGFLVSTLYAQQSVQLSGNVRDASSQAAIAGATVSLASGGLSATTDAQGAFSITGTVPVLKSGLLKEPAFTGVGSIDFELAAAKFVSVTVRTIKGTMLFRLEKHLTPGIHQLNIPVNEPGMMLVELKSGDRIFHLKQLNLTVNSGTRPEFVKTAPQAKGVLRKSAGGVDTLRATHPQYNMGTLAIDNYNSASLLIDMNYKYGLKDTSLLLPDPDGTPPDTEKPLKVFVMMGQSNMIGFGQINPIEDQGTLRNFLYDDTQFQHLGDATGELHVLNDVYHVWMLSGNPYPKYQGWLEPDNGNNQNNGGIGPELQFGHIMGHLHDEQVLLLKAAQGNRSLGHDALPPGTERFTHDGKTYAQYGDFAPCWTAPDDSCGHREVETHVGWQYDLWVAEIHEVLDNLPTYFPDYQDQGYEISGFAWFQGHKDQGQPYAGRYETNLVALINALRQEFEVPAAPFVVATIGFDGMELSGNGLEVAEGQLAVGDWNKYPDFSGNVLTVDTRGYWRDVSVSPNNAGYHYNHNAEFHILTGNAMGWAMAELLQE